MNNVTSTGPFSAYLHQDGHALASRPSIFVALILYAIESKNNPIGVNSAIPVASCLNTLELVLFTTCEGSLNSSRVVMWVP